MVEELYALLRARDDWLLAQIGGMTEILRESFLTSILSHILS